MRLAAADRIGVDRTRSLGRPAGFDSAPTRIGVEDSRTSKLTAKAERVLTGERFTAEERDELLARLILGG